MKDSNKLKLSQVVQEVLLSEQEALAQEIVQLKEKLVNRDTKIRELEKVNSSLQSVKWEYARYKWFYYTHFSICPQCEWAGGWEDGQWGWWECDICHWQWELDIKTIQDIFAKQIENEINYKR